MLAIVVVIIGFTGSADAASGAADRDRAWSVQWLYQQNSLQTVVDQSYRPTQSNLFLERRLGDAAAAGLAHDRRFLDLPAVGGVPADTNGHVHRLGASWRRDTQERRIALGVALAVSSNALKHPGELDADDVRFAGLFEQRFADPVRFGLRLDDRSGRGRVYPTAEILLSPSPAHEVRVGFPEASWRWRWAPRVHSELAVAPDGGRWRVRDAELERDSIVRQQLWRAAWIVRWQPWDALSVDGRLGWGFASVLRYQLRDGREVRVEPPDSAFFGFSIAGRF